LCRRKTIPKNNTIDQKRQAQGQGGSGSKKGGARKRVEKTSYEQWGGEHSELHRKFGEVCNQMGKSKKKAGNGQQQNHALEEKSARSKARARG